VSVAESSTILRAAVQKVSLSFFTEADSLEELPDKVRDAVRCHYDDGKAPKIVRLHHVREDVITV